MKKTTTDITAWFNQTQLEVFNVHKMPMDEVFDGLGLAFAIHPTYLKYIESNSGDAAKIMHSYLWWGLHVNDIHAALVPFQGHLCYMVMCEGIERVLIDRGIVKMGGITAKPVCANDDFLMEPLTGNILKWAAPAIRGDRIGWVVSFDLTDGRKITDYMDMAAILKRRDCSWQYRTSIKDKKGSSVWEQWPEEQERKTAIISIARKTFRASINQKTIAQEEIPVSSKAEMRNVTGEPMADTYGDVGDLEIANGNETAQITEMIRLIKQIEADSIAAGHLEPGDKTIDKAIAKHKGNILSLANYHAALMAAQAKWELSAKPKEKEDGELELF